MHKTNMKNDFRFSGACESERKVFGSCRPCNGCRDVKMDMVSAWINFMINSGIGRICCLLEKIQLDYYDFDLIEHYVDKFGFKNVLSEEVKDFTLISREQLRGRIIPFLKETEIPVLVHCSGGIGRTGQVLGAWLYIERGYPYEKVLETLRRSGRNPFEYLKNGNGSKDDYRNLLSEIKNQGAMNV